MKPLWFNPRRRRRAGRAGVLFVLALTAGCGRGEGTVSGQVLFNGQPLPGGWVIFRPAASGTNTVTAQIDPNGRYEATLPAGEVKIAVDNRELQKAAVDQKVANPEVPLKVKLPPAPKQWGRPAGSNTAPQLLTGTYVAIPRQFYDVDASHLTYTVRPGPQPHDIELK